MRLRINKATMKYIIISVPVLFLISFFFSKITFAQTNTSQSTNLGILFLTGLFTGGLTCLAVQGGLLAATVTQREEERLKAKTKQTGNALPIIAFLIAKLVSYTAFGFLLGWFGSFFKLSITAQFILQFAVGIFMIGTAFNILNVHPIFRYFVIQPPRFLARLVRKQSKSKDLFAPILLGAFTIFIPCGTTQAVMALAIASGSPLAGAAILFAFILGTSPVFFLLGYFATKLGETMHQKFMRFAAFAIIMLAIFNVNNAIALSGSNLTLDNALRIISPFDTGTENATTIPAVAVSSADIAIQGDGYNPNNLTVKAGSSITLHIKNIGGQGCTQAFTIPGIGIQKIVPMGTSDTIAFTAPKQTGPLAFMCSMGMYRGVINVI